MSQRVAEPGQVVRGNQPWVAVPAASYPYPSATVDLGADTHVGVLGA
jgi:hypothetical protein